MKFKFQFKNKNYWKNYLGYWAIFALAVLITGHGSVENGEPDDYKHGFLFVSIITSFILANLIAKKYSISDEIDELRIKEGLEHKEFNSKYGKIFEIYDK